MRRKLNEREMLIELRVVKTAFWVMWILLLVDVFSKMIIFSAPFKECAFEWAIFLSGSLIVVIGLPRKGIWGGRFKPGAKSYLIFSGIGTLIFTILFTIGRYVNDKDFFSHFGGTFAVIAITAVSVFVCLFLGLAATGSYAKKQELKEGTEAKEDED